MRGLRYRGHQVDSLALNFPMRGIVLRPKLSSFRTVAIAGVAASTMVLTACGSDSSGTSTPAGNGSSGASGGASSSGATSTLKVGMAYDVGGRGDKSFNDLAAAGLDKAKEVQPARFERQGTRQRLRARPKPTRRPG